MARKLQPATADDVTSVLDALANLRSARDRLAKAGATSALEAVRSAIKSTEGALRHVQRRYRETLDAQRREDVTTTREHYATTGESLKRGDSVIMRIGDMPVLIGTLELTPGVRIKGPTEA